MKSFDVAMLIAFILVVLSIALMLVSVKNNFTEGVVCAVTGTALSFLIIYSQRNKTSID
jgi:hypothetical protein